MTDEALVTLLRDNQSPAGALKSVVTFCHRRRYPDWNGFITALVVRALNGIPESVELVPLRERMLDFLKSCESPVWPGAFGFWPDGQTPAWIGSLPEDADDTAVMALELARYGHLDRQDILKILCKVLIPHRLQRSGDWGPPWIRRGVFLTWLRSDEQRPNIIDCCVNANVIALMAYAGLEHLPGYAEACSMIKAGVRWAGNSSRRTTSLTPFYPHPLEFLRAVENAVACGATDLQPSLRLLRESCSLRDAKSGMTLQNQPICSSAYGLIIWDSTVLQTVRYLTRNQAGQANTGYQ